MTSIWTPTRPGPLVVLGSANVDLVMRLPQLPRPGETIFGHRHEQNAGGKGLNQAIAAVRAGGKVAFIGRVGDDDDGRMLSGLLEREGVDVSRLTIDADAATGVAQVSVLDGGENAIVVAAGANAATGWAAADAALLDDASMLVAQLERPPALVHEAFVAARERGVTTVLTPAPVMPAATDLLPLVDLLLLNEHEALQLADETDPLAAARALSADERLVVLTRGARSSIVAHSGAVVHEEPIRPAEVVDTTGAGDCFAGTLVARLAAGESLEAAIHAATLAASICVSRVGAAPAMPLWSEVSALLS